MAKEFLLLRRNLKTIDMMKQLLMAMAMAWTAMGIQAATVTDTIFNRYEHENYAFGADVSFVPQMESWGTTWLDKNGKQKDILQILKDQGINNIRLRVWTVNSGASSKQEVVAMCRRAKAKGMGVMIDFHYSDTWADPGSQTIPAAWTDHSVEALAKNVYDHTYDVLSAIKKAGVVPKWVQVGNETKRGMLYPVGQTNKGGAAAFAKFVLNGYNAVKAVDSTMQVIVHLPDGHDNSLYRGIFDGLKRNGAKWDIIGLSAYPRWSHLDGPTMITKVMANINDLKNRYGKPCMVVETGHYPKEAVIGNQYLVGLMDRMIKNGDLGCFYWEPESMGGYDMGAWDEATRRPTVMMDAFMGVKHTQVPWLMKATITAPEQEESVDGNLTIKADAMHIRNRIQSLDFYVDKRWVGMVTEKPYELPLEELATGMHTVWAKVTDSDRLTQMSDTVTFFVGESALMNPPIQTNATQKGGCAQWGMDVKATGKYRLLFKFSSENICGEQLSLNGDSIGLLFFSRKTNDYLKQDIEINETGDMTLTLTATGDYGLPDIAWLRIFSLEGQEAPTPTDLAGVSSLRRHLENEMVEVYSIDGVYMGRMPQDQLGVSLGKRSSAVVALPNCVGGTPYIVRKQRLK